MTIMTNHIYNISAFFRLNHVLGGDNPVGYHLVNVLLHSLATVLFTKVCHKCVFRDIQYSSLAGLLFATHPIHTEAVSILEPPYTYLT